MKQPPKVKSALIINNLFVEIDGQMIVKDVSLRIKSGELHVIMGPNGSGKSTLARTLIGDPKYLVKSPNKHQLAKIILNRTDITRWAPEERAKKGLLLAFQTPTAVPGVTISNLIRTAYVQIHGEKNLDLVKFHHQVVGLAKELGLGKEFLGRFVNDGFSGGEMKKAEMLQLLALKPKFVIFDEIDTGLDIDALKFVANGINTLTKQGSGGMIITHYQRILQYLRPKYVHIMKHGQLVYKGNMKIVQKLEREGYAAI